MALLSRLEKLGLEITIYFSWIVNGESEMVNGRLCLFNCICYFVDRLLGVRTITKSLLLNTGDSGK